jgi:CRISPR type IV-associated protein Csf3
MEPLRVTFRFANLVSVSDSLLHLDGLLAWAAVERARQQGETDLDRAAESLPLARQGKPEVWCASALQFDYRSPPSFRTLVRKTDVDDYVDAIVKGRIKLAKPRDQLPVGSGPLRNYLVSYAVRQADFAVAWCVGDAQAVRGLLAQIRHVGRFGRMGYGLIEKVSVDRDDAAKEMWKLRHLPWREDGYLPCIGNFRAPYWDKTTMTEVFAPPAARISVARTGKIEEVATT